jgi:large subunit ribosomal protein L25
MKLRDIFARGAVADFTLEVHRRDATGKAANRRYRHQGLVPGVVYHKGEDSVPALLAQREFVQLAQQAKRSQVFILKSADQSLDGRPVIVREVQRDYLKGSVIHVDLQALTDDEEITVRVPVQLQGEAPGVKNEGGILAFVTHELGVSCFPKDIPQTIAIDISELHLGGSIHASQVGLPSGVRLVDDPEETIVSVVAARATKTDVEAGAEETATAAPAAPAGKATAKSAGGKGGKK